MTILKKQFGAPPSATPLPPPPPPPPPPVRLRTLKIDNLQNFIGNVTQENIVLQFAADNGFNHIQFYGLYSIFNTTLENYLPSLISRAYSVFNMQRVGAIMGAGTTGFQYVINYNAGVSLNERFNDFNKENEFWNYPNPGTETYAAWIASLQWLYPQLNHSTEFLSAYVQNYVSSPAWGAPEAAQMVQVIDVFEATNFTTAPDENQVSLSMLQLVANAANGAGKTQQVQPLLSSEANYMGPYFNANGMAYAESVWNSQYALDTLPNKSNLDIVGFNYFDYSQLENFLQ